jgi:DNA-binding HxlR family transcriptional regulator
MQLLDVLGRRWTLRILWELRGSALTFRALREACGGVSPSVLNQRLGELKELGVIDAVAGGYALTPRGESLGEHLLSLDEWARKWLGSR